MDLQSVLKALINARGYTYKAIGKRIGISAQSVSNRLNKTSALTVTTLLKYLEILDCELIIRGKREKDDCWLITKPIADKDGE